MENLYAVSVVVCLALYVLINWYDQMDLAVSDLVMFLLAALIPVVNICFLAYMLIVALAQLDIMNISFPTILKGRRR